MIKALLLVFRPVPAWNAIKARNRRSLFILFFHVLPLLVLTSAGEGFGLLHWGKVQWRTNSERKFPVAEVVAYEGSQVLLLTLLVIICAFLVKSFAETFRARHNYRQSFTAVAYSLSPLFVLRLMDAAPLPLWLSFWPSWVIGICLTLGVLYHGVPKIMDPDPPQAFGLYVTGAVVLLLVTALVRFPIVIYLLGEFPALRNFFTDIGGRLPL